MADKSVGFSAAEIPNILLAVGAGLSSEDAVAFAKEFGDRWGDEEWTYRDAPRLAAAFKTLLNEYLGRAQNG